MEGAPLAQTQIPNRRSSSGGRRQHPVKRYKRRRRGAIWALYTFVAVLAVLVVGAYAAGTFFITPPPVKEARTQVTAPAAGKTEKEEQNEAGGEAPQVAGTGALKRKEGVYNFLLLGSDKGGGNADTIIVASYDTKSQKVGVLSVPRDTMVDRDWSRNGKINAALGTADRSCWPKRSPRRWACPLTTTSISISRALWRWWMSWAAWMWISLWI